MGSNVAGALALSGLARLLTLDQSLLDAFGVGVSVLSPDGTILRYNALAAKLWGRSPQAGDPAEKFNCGLRLYTAAGEALAHSEAPAAIALRSGEPQRDIQLMVEHADGTRLDILANVLPLRDVTGRIEGAIDCFHDLTGWKRADNDANAAETRAHLIARADSAETAARRLAAIVESSDDAIVSKDLNSNIQSWNKGAERIFGWTANEAIGKPVTILFPAGRFDEEPQILARIRNGERIDHYETVRKRKDGTLIDVSLTVSPVRDETGMIVGASKIARDVSERKRIERQRDLLMAELSHRVKNTLATVLSIERLSFSDVEDFTAARQIFCARIRALAHAHGQLAESSWMSVSLRGLVDGSLAPFMDAEGQNIVLPEDSIELNPQCALSLGLAVHELTTNAAKYGALSTASGRLYVSWYVEPETCDLIIEWKERGGPEVKTPSRVGFGRTLVEQALAQELTCTVKMDFAPEGLTCLITIPRKEYETRFD